jgi:hypothetical protein
VQPAIQKSSGIVIGFLHAPNTHLAPAPGGGILYRQPPELDPAIALQLLWPDETRHRRRFTVSTKEAVNAS